MILTSLTAATVAFWTVVSPAPGPEPSPVLRSVERAVAPGPEPSPVLRSVERAMAVLEPHVEQKSHPRALTRAFAAYYEYAEAHPDRVTNPYLYFVDYGLDNRTARGYVFDMDALRIVEGPFTVAHGRGSSNGRNGVPVRFSNRPGSYATSLGLYRTRELYRFSGKAGGRRYTATGLRLQGVSPGFNDAARRRGVVAHGAPYVTAGDAGRSEGCPAMEPDRADRLLPLIADGGMVYLFSPRDPVWLADDPWGRLATSP